MWIRANRTASQIEAKEYRDNWSQLERFDDELIEDEQTIIMEILNNIK